MSQATSWRDVSVGLRAKGFLDRVVVKGLHYDEAPNTRGIPSATGW